MSIEGNKYRSLETGDETNPTLADFDKRDDNFISSKQYAKKYGIELRRLPPACRKEALISKKITVRDERRNQDVARWVILDIPFKEHPKWDAYDIEIKKYLKKEGADYEKKFDEWAPIFLERFKERPDIGKASFTQTEIAKILGTIRGVIQRWTDIGVKGYGQLPRMQFPDDKREKYGVGRVDSFYQQTFIVRFLQKELADPRKKFKTIDDAIVDTEINMIAEKHGYFVYDQNRVYKIGYEGFIKWAEDNVCREDKILGKWVPFRAIGMQRECYKKVWELKKDGTLKHRFIRLCRPRGDFKSFDAIITFLFRFFNMPREKILLAANSKDQSDYALYDEARDIIINSPKLMATPGLKLKENDICLMASKNDIFSRIKSIASKQGALSNATCVVFSEIYKLKDQQFISELEGSIRGVPNAMSIIESTVSREGTYYHRQYLAFIEGKSPLMYFQYYCDRHFNPELTLDQLQHYEASFFPDEYNMFFRNRWGDAGEGLFSTAQIYEIGVLAIDGKLGPCHEMTDAIKELLEMELKLGQLKGATDTSKLEQDIQRIKKRFTYVDELYQLPATSVDMENILKKYDLSEFFVGMGIDRAEQLSANTDRTVVSTVGKAYLDSERWICFLFDVLMPDSPRMTDITNCITNNSGEYGWISQVDVEKFQGLDIHTWCEDNAYTSTLQPASYEHQHAIFLEVFKLVKEGLFKSPTVPMWHDDKDIIYRTLPSFGMDDIMREEMKVFEHEARTTGKKAGRFGSPFKRTGRTKKGETKDDLVYSLGHAVNAANTGDVPASALNIAFAGAQINRDVVGDY